MIIKTSFKALKLYKVNKTTDVVQPPVVFNRPLIMLQHEKSDVQFKLILIAFSRICSAIHWLQIVQMVCTTK